MNFGGINQLAYEEWNQLISFHKTNTKGEEWEDGGSRRSSNQTYQRTCRSFSASYDLFFPVAATESEIPAKCLARHEVILPVLGKALSR